MSANVLKSLDEKEIIQRKINAIRQSWTPEEKMERKKVGEAALLFLLAIAEDGECNDLSRIKHRVN